MKNKNMILISISVILIILFLSSGIAVETINEGTLEEQTIVRLSDLFINIGKIFTETIPELLGLVPDLTEDPYYRSAQLGCWCIGNKELVSYEVNTTSNQGSITCDDRSWDGSFTKDNTKNANPSRIFSAKTQRIYFSETSSGIASSFFYISSKDGYKETWRVSCGIGKAPYTNSGTIPIVIDGVATTKYDFFLESEKLK